MSGSPARCSVVAVVALTLSAESAARAHDRTTSYSSWRISQREAKVVLNMSEVDAASVALPSGKSSALDAALAKYAFDHLTILANDKLCKMAGPPSRLDGRAGRALFAWTLSIPAEGSLRVRSDLFAETISGHLHFASVHHQQGSTERVLTVADRSWDLGPEVRTAGPSGAPTSLGGYWLLGVEHIATGYDHLVFLLALLLSGGSFTLLVKVVTGFTVGHSITLALASLRLVEPQIQPIEALIGLSIVLVAVENVWLLGPRTWLLPGTMIVLLVGQAVLAAVGAGRLSSVSCLGFAVFLSCYYPLLRRSQNVESARWAVALIFGLIHGFGFAAVLQAAELPAERLVAVLVSFNVGVESGQLVLVAIAWPLLQLAFRRWKPIVVAVGSAAAMGLGAYWLVARAY